MVPGPKYDARWIEAAFWADAPHDEEESDLDLLVDPRERTTLFTLREAATRIQQQAPDFVKAHAELPWIQMRGMKNRLIHNYFDVNIDVLWAAVKEDLPKLKEQLEALEQ